MYRDCHQHPLHPRVLADLPVPLALRENQASPVNVDREVLRAEMAHQIRQNKSERNSPRLTALVVGLMRTSLTGWRSRSSW